MQQLWQQTELISPCLEELVKEKLQNGHKERNFLQCEQHPVWFLLPSKCPSQKDTQIQTSGAECKLMREEELEWMKNKNKAFGFCKNL